MPYDAGTPPVIAHGHLMVAEKWTRCYRARQGRLQETVCNEELHELLANAVSAWKLPSGQEKIPRRKQNVPLMSRNAAEYLKSLKTDDWARLKPEKAVLSGEDYLNIWKRLSGEP